jgi:hypothetical protein
MMRHLVSNAVNPTLSMTNCIEHWHQIAKQLAEPPRRRRRRMTRLTEE